VKSGKQAADEARDLYLAQQGKTAAAVTRDGGAVTLDDPPGGIAHLYRNGGEQVGDQRVRTGQQGDLLAPVEQGDDTRRPTAEASAAVEDEYWTWKKLGWVGAHKSLNLRIFDKRFNRAEADTARAKF
jgi:hypothetical protein